MKSSNHSSVPSKIKQPVKTLRFVKASDVARSQQPSQLSVTHQDFRSSDEEDKYVSNNNNNLTFTHPQLEDSKGGDASEDQLQDDILLTQGINDDDLFGSDIDEDGEDDVLRYVQTEPNEQANTPFDMNPSMKKGRMLFADEQLP